MTDDEIQTVSKREKPDARREQTDMAFREIKSSEAAQRREKSERLKQARLEANRGV